MTRYSQKWAVAAFFQEYPSNFSFPASNKPLHLTLALPFKAKNEIDVFSVFADQFSSMQKFEIVGGNEEDWSHVIVTAVEISDTLKDLYTNLQESLVKIGAEFDQPEVLGKDFTPHVTDQEQGKMQSGEVWTVKQIALINIVDEMLHFTKVANLL